MRSRSPGPAHYTQPAWQFMHVDPPSSAQQGSFHRYPYKHAWAQSKVNRTASILVESGDPALYEKTNNDLAPASCRSFNKQAAEGRAAFNIRHPARPSSAPPRSERRGPGEYDHAAGCKIGVGVSQVRSPFRSSTDGSNGHIRKSITPGVGEYDPHGNPDHVQAKCLLRSRHSFSRDGSSMFAGAGTKSRTPLADELASRTDRKVGPGAYEVCAPYCLAPRLSIRV